LDVSAAGDLDAIKRHIANGVDILVAKEGKRNGLTPIVLAARNGHLEACQLLVQHGASIFHAGRSRLPALTAIGEAIRRCDLAFFRALLNLSTAENREGFVKGNLLPYIVAAVSKNSHEVLLELLSWNSSSPEKCSFSEMLGGIASYKSNILAGHQCLELILRHEFPSTESGNSRDAWYPSLATPDPNNHGQTPLHESCFCGSRPAAIFLLENLDKGDIRTADTRGNTPLHLSARAKHPDLFILKRLLELDEGVSFSITNNEGWKPFNIACSWHYGVADETIRESVFDLLLEFGAHFLSDEDGRGQTPLHDLVGKNRLSSARKLLATGRVDPRKPNRDGETPFLMAAGHPHSRLEMMKLLLSYDSSLAAEGSLTSLPLLAHALNRGSPENIGFLLALPEANTLLDDSWVDFLSFSPHRLTKGLVLGCLIAKKPDLTKRVLRDRKVDLSPFSTVTADMPLGDPWRAKFGVDALQDHGLLELAVLRQLIAGDTLTSQHLATFDEEVQHFFEEDDVNADWKVPLMDIDPTIPFSMLASFAIHDRNKSLVQLLVDEGHSDAIDNVTSDPLTKEKLEDIMMDVPGWWLR
jgi:ankyrin repeat protein